MRIKIDRDHLAQALRAIAPVTSRAKIMPILRHARLRTGSNGGPVTLEATNLELSLTVPLPRAVSTPSEGLTVADGGMDVLIRADVWKDMVTKLDAGDLIIEDRYDENTISIAQGSFSASFACVDPADFPELVGSTTEGENGIPMDAPALSTTAGDFLALMDRTAYAMGKDETRYVLTGLWYSTDALGHTAVATNGNRLAACGPINDVKDGIVIPRDTIRYLPKILTEPDEALTVTWTPRLIRIAAGDRLVVVSRLIQGRYPDWRAVITRSTRRVTVKKAILERAIKAVAAVEELGDPLSLTFEGDTITLHVTGAVGSATTAMKAERTNETPENPHETMTLLVQPRYMAEAIGRVRGEECTINIPFEGGPLGIEDDLPPDNGEAIHLIMPLRH